MVEPEVAFMELDENMELAEAFICAVVGHVLERCKEELEILERDLSALEKVVPPFPRVSYKEAIQILSNKGIEITFGDDFGGDDETVLAKEFDRPVIVHRYPSASKAFYMKHDPEAPDVALCMDVLAPEGYGEIIGGGQREDDLEALKSRINDHDLPMEDFEWFLDLRRYGTVPHSGFGAGLERMVAWICGLHHVRETIPFPRLMDRLSP
jgi:asparaginyl-tRNA synthetase